MNSVTERLRLLLYHMHVLCCKDLVLLL